jgi:UDP-N-acetylmuramoyl-tripeptide--D-alanyl-D-alanine ligase
VIPLTLAEIADVVAGRLAGGADPGAVVSGEVVTDSRQAAAGDLFVAIVGERLDGHAYAAQVSDAGAVAVLASRELGVPCVVVGDTVVALGRLARAVLDRLPALVVVGVTGSSGKTSTKDLLAQTLPLLGATVSPPGSFNNEIGLPTTALRVRADTGFLISEMGARGIGHIRYLCGVTPARVGVVLNVGSAHVGEFGGRDAIARAKCELVESLPSAVDGGIAVLNADDVLVAAMSSRTAARVVTFGETASADVRAEDVVVDDQARPTFVIAYAGARAVVSLRLHGRHHVSNALATAAVALSLGAGLTDVATALSEAGPASRWRMDVTETSAGVTVVNDAYNANPESVRAALEALVAMSPPSALAQSRRSWAVLGEMRELGEASQAEHEAIGRLALELGIDRLVIVGEPARAVHTGAVRAGGTQERAVLVPDVDAAVTLLRSELTPGDVVLVKASRSVGLERIAAALVGVDR